VSRAITMIHRYRSGVVPQSLPVNRQTADQELLTAAANTIDSVQNHFGRFGVIPAIQEPWSRISRVNKFIVEREPWTLAKDPSKADDLDRTLYHAADSL